MGDIFQPPKFTVLEINRQTIDKSTLNEYFLEELEDQLLKEVGLN